MRTFEEIENLTVNQRVGMKIKQARELRGLTAPALVERLSKYELSHPVSANIISRWELGKQAIPTDSLIAIMKELECSPYYVFSDMSPIEDEEKQLHNIIHGLPQKEKHILMGFYTRWKGCAHTLIEAGAMYACLDKPHRKTAIRHLIRLFEKSRDEIGETALDVDIQKVYDGMMRLDKKD